MLGTVHQKHTGIPHVGGGVESTVKVPRSAVSRDRQTTHDVDHEAVPRPASARSREAAIVTTASSDHRLGQVLGLQSEYARRGLPDRAATDDRAPKAPNGVKRPNRRANRAPRTTPVIKPSVVHIPAHLLPLITEERARSGRSNGQILIAAIEAGYEHLVKQHGDSATIGGRLFTSRTAKPQLPASQPLSPLNIRMYVHDYDVLDKLVAELGAGSRSRLATLALVHYLDGSP